MAEKDMSVFEAGGPNDAYAQYFSGTELPKYAFNGAGIHWQCNL